MRLLSYCVAVGGGAWSGDVGGAEPLAKNRLQRIGPTVVQVDSQQL